MLSYHGVLVRTNWNAETLWPYVIIPAAIFYMLLSMVHVIYVLLTVHCSAIISSPGHPVCVYSEDGQRALDHHVTNTTGMDFLRDKHD